MDALTQTATQLQSQVNEAADRLHIDELVQQKAALDAQVATPDFWQQPAEAQEVVKQQAKLERRIQPWVQLRQDIADVLELAAMADEGMRPDLEEQLRAAQATFDTLKAALKFSGPYDDYDAIISIHAGAGARMLRIGHRCCCVCMCAGQRLRASQCRLLRNRLAMRLASRA